MPSTDEDTRLDCLNRMVGVLRDRSNVDKMYVSWSTNSSAPFGARDNNGYDVKTACCCDGDTQDMLRHIRLEKNPVIIVSITYAGFTTNCRDLIEFLEFHRNVKYLVVDNYAVNGKFDVLSRDDIIHSSCIAERFRCRTATYH
ncbi:hypothetical protein DFQ29_003807, partial [Apophysomyces sp. BC1021]